LLVAASLAVIMAAMLIALPVKLQSWRVAQTDTAELWRKLGDEVDQAAW
jgi:hypothetical protein